MVNHCSSYASPPISHYSTLADISLLNTHHWENIATKLRAIPGMVEVTFIAEESIAYLKMERDALKHPDFISLKEQTVGYI